MEEEERGGVCVWARNGVKTQYNIIIICHTHIQLTTSGVNAVSFVGSTVLASCVIR